MKNIIIVEDNKQDSDKLSEYIHQFFNNINEDISIKTFVDGLDMLDHYMGNEDIIFLDMDLPHINGLELAKRIRKVDSLVTIIFVSNLVKFALKGYEVDALDYIIKPFKYNNIEHRLQRALKVKNYDNESIILKLNSSTNVVCDINTIYYIEKEGNYLIFHTSKEDYKVRGNINEYEKILPKWLFSFSIKGILINLSYVEKTTQDSVIVNNVNLPLARQRKKEFIEDLFTYFGEKRGEN